MLGSYYPSREIGNIAQKSEYFIFNVLDMGTGTGILGIVATLRLFYIFYVEKMFPSDVKAVCVRTDLVDLNPYAVKCAAGTVMDSRSLIFDSVSNLYRHAREHITTGGNLPIPFMGFRFYRSYLFDNIPPNKYDLILFNAPYLPSEDLIGEENRLPIDIAWDAGTPDGTGIYSEFVGKLGRFSHSETDIFITTSSLADRKKIGDIFKTAGFRMMSVDSVKLFFETVYLERLKYTE